MSRARELDFNTPPRAKRGAVRAPPYSVPSTTAAARAGLFGAVRDPDGAGTGVCRLLVMSANYSARAFWFFRSHGCAALSGPGASRSSKFHNLRYSISSCSCLTWRQRPGGNGNGNSNGPDDSDRCRVSAPLQAMTASAARDDDGCRASAP